MCAHQVLEYQAGQHYHPHHDFFDPAYYKQVALLFLLFFLRAITTALGTTSVYTNGCERIRMHIHAYALTRAHTSAHARANERALVCPCV